MVAWGLTRVGALFLSAIFIYYTLFFSATSGIWGFYFFFLITNVFLYSHYLMALLPTIARAKDKMKSWHGRWILLLLFAIAATSIFINPEIGFIWFGFHFALSETYSRSVMDGDKEFFASSALRKRTFRFLQTMLILAAYFFGTRHTVNYVIGFEPIRPFFQSDLIPVILTLLLIGYSGFLAFEWRRIFPQRSGREVIFAYVLPEALIIGFCLMAGFYNFHWVAIVLYHITFWFLAPILSQNRQPAKKLTFSYVLPTIAIMLIAAWYYPKHLTGTLADMPFFGYTSSGTAFFGFHPYVMTTEAIRYIHGTMNWGTVHIWLSLALSSLNPQFINALTNRK